MAKYRFYDALKMNVISSKKNLDKVFRQGSEFGLMQNQFEPSAKSSICDSKNLDKYFSSLFCKNKDGL